MINNEHLTVFLKVEDVAVEECCGVNLNPGNIGSWTKVRLEVRNPVTVS